MTTTTNTMVCPSCNQDYIPIMSVVCPHSYCLGCIYRLRGAAAAATEEEEPEEEHSAERNCLRLACPICAAPEAFHCTDTIVGEHANEAACQLTSRVAALQAALNESQQRWQQEHHLKFRKQAGALAGEHHEPGREEEAEQRASAAAIISLRGRLSVAQELSARQQETIEHLRGQNAGLHQALATLAVAKEQEIDRLRDKVGLLSAAVQQFKERQETQERQQAIGASSSFGRIAALGAAAAAAAAGLSSADGATMIAPHPQTVGSSGTAAAATGGLLLQALTVADAPEAVPATSSEAATRGGGNNTMRTSLLSSSDTTTTTEGRLFGKVDTAKTNKNKRKRTDEITEESSSGASTSGGDEGEGTTMTKRRPSNSNNKMAKMSLDERWDAKFQDLKTFAEKHGHCRVSHDSDLGFWVQHQRRRYYRNPGNFGADRIRKLESIGFSWDPRSNAWEKHFAALVQFKKEHGHCNVRQSNIKLHDWLKYQRSIYNGTRKNGSQTEEQIRRLLDLGVKLKM